MPSRSRMVTLATARPTVVTDVEACQLPIRTKQMPLAGDISRQNFVPHIGDSYIRCRHPVTGVERRCVITGISSVGGSFASVRFFEGDEIIAHSEPVIVTVRALEPILYPRLDLANENEAVLKSKLLLTCPATGLHDAEAARRLVIFGPNLVPEPRQDSLPERLQCCWGSMPCMIWTAILVGALRAAWTDCAVLLMLQLINGLVGWHEEMKAADAVSTLKESLQPHARCRRNGADSNVLASTLVPGDIVLLEAGSAVPADCELLSGSVQVNTARLTGQLAPVAMRVGQIALTGCEIVSGSCETVVYDHGPHTYRAKKAARMAKGTAMAQVGEFQNLLTLTTTWLTVLSLLLVCIVCGLLLYRKYTKLDVAAFGVVLLVATVPIALPVVWRSALAIGARALAHQAGAILTSLCGMERLASIDVLCITSQEIHGDIRETVRQAREFGVGVKLLENVDDQHGATTLSMLGRLRQRGCKYGLTGQGVDDAERLRAAYLGIALHGATDTTHAASDLVLTTPKLTTIVDAIVLSREILQGLLSYVIYRVSSSTCILSLFAITAVFPSLMSPRKHNGMSPACQNTYSKTSQPQGAAAFVGVAADMGKTEQHAAALTQIESQLCRQQFLLPVTVIVLMTILNNVTILSIPHDKVIASRHPTEWRMHEAALASTLLGLTSASAAAMLLYFGLAANAADSWFVSLGIIQLPVDNTFSGTHYGWQLASKQQVKCSAEVTIGGGDEVYGIDSPRGCDWSMCSPPEWTGLTATQQLMWQQPSFCFRYEQLQTMLFLQLSLSTCMTVWSARSRGSAFRARSPGRSLLVASLSVLLSVILLAWKWPFAELEPLSLRLIGWTCIYNIGWFVVQDTAKLVLFKALTFQRWRSSDHVDFNCSAQQHENESNSTARSMLPPRLASCGTNRTCPDLRKIPDSTTGWS